jgi:two-component system sensor kinase FixL
MISSQLNVKQMEKSELQQALEELETHPPSSLTPKIDAHKAVLHELHVHQIELEMQNRELRASQKVIEQSRERYAELYDSAPAGYMTLDAKGVVRDVNLTAAKMLGAGRSQLLELPLTSRLESGGSIALFDFIKRVLRQNDSQELELRMRCVGNEFRDVRLTGLAARQEQQVCRCTLYDITEEKQRQETLRLHSTILEKMSEGVMLVRDSDHTIIETNSALDRMFGYATGELTGHQASVLNDPADQAWNRDIKQALRQSGEWQGEVAGIMKDGTRFWCEVSISAFSHYQYGNLWLEVRRDISARKRAEQQEKERREVMAHTARLNTVGELAANLAHELTQPLMAVEYFNEAAATVAKSDAIDREQLLELLHSVSKQTQRTGNIIKQLRRFVQRGRVDKTPVNIRAIVEDALSWLQPLLDEKKIAVEITGQDSLSDLLILGDPVQIEQVLVNLLRNSIDALSGGDTRKITIALEQEGDRIQVTVQDTGPGLDPAWAARIFDVFETDKSNGMGMGLAISRSIVTAHGGRLWHDPAYKSGAVFHFTLPVTES